MFVDNYPQQMEINDVATTNLQIDAFGNGCFTCALKCCALIACGRLSKQTIASFYFYDIFKLPANTLPS